MNNPDYITAIGLVLDIIGALLLANDLFSVPRRQSREDRLDSYIRHNNQMRDSVVEMYRKLPTTVYSPEAIEELCASAMEHYAQRARSFTAEIADEAKMDKDVSTKYEWRGVGFLCAGFLLQLIGALL